MRVNLVNPQCKVYKNFNALPRKAKQRLTHFQKNSLKQMKLIHDGGFTNEEREAYREIIFSNSLQSIHVLLEAMENLDIPLSDQNNQGYFDFIMDQPQQIDHFSMPPEVTRAIKALWQDEGVREAHRRRNEFQLNDSASL